MRFRLCDRDPAVVEAWRAQFANHSEVDVSLGDVLAVGAEALVLPGNSFGFLDRGLSLAVSERFGWSLQDELRSRIRTEHDGELLVGQALVLPLEGGRLLVYAPIARTPQPLGGTLNAYLAARGAFRALRSTGAQSVVVPGLGTGSGKLHPLVSARQLRYAFEQATGLRGSGDKNLAQLQRRDQKLRSLPRATEGVDDS